MSETKPATQFIGWGFIVRNWWLIVRAYWYRFRSLLGWRYRRAVGEELITSEGHVYITISDHPQDIRGRPRYCPRCQPGE